MITGIERVEIAHRDGTRAMGVLIAETPENFKIAYKGVVTDYERPKWFRVEPRQYSTAFKAYQTYAIDKL